MPPHEHDDDDLAWWHQQDADAQQWYDPDDFAADANSETANAFTEYEIWLTN